MNYKSPGGLWDTEDDCCERRFFDIPKAFLLVFQYCYFLISKLRLQMHARPPLHSRRRPLHFGLRLWEKWIPHLQWTLHWYYPSCRCVQTTLNVPRRYFWHHWLPQQYWPQILNIRYVLRSQVIQMYVKSCYFILCFLEELLQKSTAMNMGALALKNASEYIQARTEF